VPEKVSDGWAAWWSRVRRSDDAVDKAAMGDDGWGISVLFFLDGETIWTDGCPQWSITEKSKFVYHSITHSSANQPKDHATYGLNIMLSVNH
jgi:hypothetical protein